MKPQMSGRALVLTRAGGRYVADVAILDGLAHCSRVRQRFGACEDVWHRPAADRIWPMRELREVRWLGSVAA